MELALLDVACRRLDQARWTVTRPDAATIRIAHRRGSANEVTAYEHRSTGERALVLVARIVSEAAASPRLVLELAGRMGAGALALAGGHYIVRFTIPAAQLATAPLADAVEYVGRLAAELASSLYGVRTQTDPELFSHYGG